MVFIVNGYFQQAWAGRLFHLSSYIYNLIVTWMMLISTSSNEHVMMMMNILSIDMALNIL